MKLQLILKALESYAPVGPVEESERAVLLRDLKNMEPGRVIAVLLHSERDYPHFANILTYLEEWESCGSDAAPYPPFESIEYYTKFVKMIR